MALGAENFKWGIKIVIVAFLGPSRVGQHGYWRVACRPALASVGYGDKLVVGREKE